MLGFATAIDAESALKNGISVQITRFLVYLPLNPTYRFIFKFTLKIMVSDGEEKVKFFINWSIHFYQVVGCRWVDKRVRMLGGGCSKIETPQLLKGV